MKSATKNRGFSLSEVKKAELTTKDLDKADIMLDTRRRSCKDENVKLLKTLVKRSKKEIGGKESIDEEKLAVQDLSELEGLTSKLISKLNDLGVESPADFLAEETDDLIVFLNVEEDQVEDWKKQIKG